MTDTIGTAYYIAPEVLNNCYGKECDIWSIGVIGYILISGTAPFRGKTDKEIMQSIQLGQLKFDAPVWKQVSPVAIHFISSCLTYDLSKRITALEALQHDYIV